MDEEFLSDFFNELENEVDNSQFINGLKEMIGELDENDLKKLIEDCF